MSDGDRKVMVARVSNNYAEPYLMAIMTFVFKPRHNIVTFAPIVQDGEMAGFMIDDGITARLYSMFRICTRHKPPMISFVSGVFSQRKLSVRLVPQFKRN